MHRQLYRRDEVPNGTPMTPVNFIVSLLVPAQISAATIVNVDDTGSLANPNVLLCPHVLGCAMNGTLPGTEPSPAVFLSRSRTTPNW